MRRQFLATAVACILLAGCAQHNKEEGASAEGNGHEAEVKVTRIEVGPDAQKRAQEAMIQAEDGEVIEFGEGKFEFDSTLSLEDVRNVTIRGMGMDKTILNFAKQQGGTGGEGIKITGSDGPAPPPPGEGAPADAEPGEGEPADAAAAAEEPATDVAATPAAEATQEKSPDERDNFVIADLTIQDSTSDAIKVEGATGVTFRNVKTEWTRGAHTDNGAYGVYPVLCRDVLLDGCVAIGASDAGLYVGQCENVIVRNCRAEDNVAGIEIENTIGADVYNNVATNNTGGILVFTLPGLPKKVGKNTRVYDNQIIENNHENFAKEGNVVATIPPGSGMFIMANDKVEVFNNTFKNNGTFNMAIISYLITQRAFADKEYDPYPESIYVHDNTFEGGGDNPAGFMGTTASSLLGGVVPDIVYDGFVDEKKLVDGQLPSELRIYIKDNGDADFANLDAAALLTGKAPNIDRDLASHAGELPPLEAITIEGVE